MTRSSLLPIQCYSLGIISALFLLFATQVCNAAYYGKLIGKLSELEHGVSGEVYAVDGRTLFIKDFTYDGEGPAAFFYAGNSKAPSNTGGFKVRDERGTTNVLKRYRKKDITLTLPEGKTLNNIKWFCVWCDEFSVNFGDVKIPRAFDFPKPQKLASLNGVHGVSSEPVVIVDAQTLLIPSFSYNGQAPDAKFWAGPGPTPSPQGIRIPDENGKEQPLRRYDRKTIVLTLPGNLTIHQLGHFGVWCEAFTVDFGHVQIPRGLNVPPSLKMLGVSPQNVRGGQGQSPANTQNQETKIPFISPFSSQHHLQDQQPTTYRPPFHNNEVQIIQSINYKIPNSLQLQDPFREQYHQIQEPHRRIQQFHQESSGLNFANDALSASSQLRQLADVHSSQPIQQHYQEFLDNVHPSNLHGEAQRFIDENRNTGFSANVHRPREFRSSQFAQPQQISYSRFQQYPSYQRDDIHARP